MVSSLAACPTAWLCMVCQVGAYPSGNPLWAHSLCALFNCTQPKTLLLQESLPPAVSGACRDAKMSAARAEASAEHMTFTSGSWWHSQGHLLHMPSHLFVRIGR